MPLEKVLSIPEPPPIEQLPENRRLWIGNLDSCVSEYHLLKTLEKHGRLEKFDLLFHRSGPLAGQPRGYAFVTYFTREQAEQMKEALDGKKIGNKHVVVRWAHNLNMEEKEKQKIELDIPVLTGGKNEQKISRTTKIQAIEAKLKMMENNSESEFQLNDGPSGVNCFHQAVNRGKQTKSFHKSKIYSKPYHRR